MNLRVGYINIQGFRQDKWEVCHKLLHDRFDYLFVAETWFIKHAQYTQDRRLIISTPPPPKNLRGRSRGGIYLLGSHHARSKIDRCRVTEHSITFVYGKISCTGVYFPPSTLSLAGIQAILESVKSSTIILGDINTRFRDPIHQAGQPGPHDRVQVFVRFRKHFGYQHYKPESNLVQLTTDHCFIKTGQTGNLTLLSNTALKISTDHLYTMDVTLGRPKTKESCEGIYRFRIGGLKKHQSELQRLIATLQNPFDPGDTIEIMNDRLVRRCQEICRKTIGSARNQTKPVSSTRQPQTLAGSIRLYKQASQASDENDVILPSEEAQAQNIDARQENLALFKKRWAGNGFTDASLAPTKMAGWTKEDLIQEIIQQEADKSCGADGIHIRFLKASLDTQVIDWLLELYNQCLAQNTTPQAWNQSEIYLLSKDPKKRRDAKNLRPIAIISIFRKIFERLLLLQIQHQSWAQLHPAQAGFRRTYSTLSNAAVVHDLLASKRCTIAIFLDLKAAFDMVDHQLLDAKLMARGCPTAIRRLLHQLNFTNMKSRLLINQQVTEWFSRTQGVLQGSPLSPWLFNIFIDDLLEEVNSSGRIRCLFYADDGVLCARSRDEVIVMVKMVESWTLRNRIMLNPAKCGIISWEILTLEIYQTPIPQASVYTYLGFPVTADGIDFSRHLTQRMLAAAGRAHWLGVQSKTWGPAHRLRIYKQFLAPMFEYGAPLVYTWAQDNQQAFEKATVSFKSLMAWISNTSNSRHKITANLCGLSSLLTRFQRLRTAYQLVLDQMGLRSPLKQLLSNPNQSLFISRLHDNAGFVEFKATTNFHPTVHAALRRFLRATLAATIQNEASQAHLTSLIPMRSRKVPGLFLADIVLAAAGSMQSNLFQYRRGVFLFQQQCKCHAKFGRGHEDCAKLNVRWNLTRKQKEQKKQMWLDLMLDKSRFTDTDFLLNCGLLQEVGCQLAKIQAILKKEYNTRMTLI